MLSNGLRSAATHHGVAARGPSRLPVLETFYAISKLLQLCQFFLTSQVPLFFLLAELLDGKVGLGMPPSGSWLICLAYLG